MFASSLTTRVRSERLQETLATICSHASPDLPSSFHPDKLDEKTLGIYLVSSFLRLQTFAALMENAGYRSKIQKVPYKNSSGTNAHFFRGKCNNPLFVTAHHDYCGGVGATDNGSGLAVIAEAATVLAEAKSDLDVVIGSFDLEEAGLVGSRANAASIGDLVRKKIRGVVNIDSVGFGQDLVFLKYPDVKIEPERTALIREVIQEQARDLGVPIAEFTYGEGRSDHIPFLQHGVPAVTLMAINGELYNLYKTAVNGPAQHVSKKPKWSDVSVINSERDTLDKVSVRNLEMATKCLLASIEKLAVRRSG